MASLNTPDERVSPFPGYVEGCNRKQLNALIHDDGRAVLIDEDILMITIGDCTVRLDRGEEGLGVNLRKHKR